MILPFSILSCCFLCTSDTNDVFLFRYSHVWPILLVTMSLNSRRVPGTSSPILSTRVFRPSCKRRSLPWKRRTTLQSSDAFLRKRLDVATVKISELNREKAIFEKFSSTKGKLEWKQGLRIYSNRGEVDNCLVWPCSCWCPSWHHG